MAGIELCKFTHGLGLYIRILPRAISISCSAFDKTFENNENINLYTHSKKIHKWDQEKCSYFQNQIDLRKIDELKKLLNEVTSTNLNITEAS
jgi:hypothetical protein